MVLKRLGHSNFFSAYFSGIIQSQVPLPEYLSNILRFLLLWKFGGFFLENDILVTKYLFDLDKNFGILDNDNVVSSSIINFGADGNGHEWTDHILNIINQDYKKQHSKANETLSR